MRQTATMVKAVLAVLAASLLALPSSLTAQSGGDDENKRVITEEERAETWTNEDLKRLERGRGVSVLGEGGGRVSPTVEGAPGRPREWWQRRAQLHFSRLEELDSEIAALEQRLARAVNPYTRALAGTVTDEEGNQRPATPGDLQALIERKRQILEREQQSLGRLQEAAERERVPEDWLRPGESGQGTGDLREPPPLFIRPKSDPKREKGQAPLYVDPNDPPEGDATDSIVGDAPADD